MVSLPGSALGLFAKFSPLLGFFGQIVPFELSSSIAGLREVQMSLKTPSVSSVCRLRPSFFIPSGCSFIILHALASYFPESCWCSTESRFNLMSALLFFAFYHLSSPECFSGEIEIVPSPPSSCDFWLLSPGRVWKWIWSRAGQRAPRRPYAREVDFPLYGSQGSLSCPSSGLS